VMDSLHSNLSVLKEKLEQNNQSTLALLDKVNSLKGNYLKKKKEWRDNKTPHDENVVSSEESEAANQEVERLQSRERELLNVIANLDMENQYLADSVEEFHTTLDMAMSKYYQETEFVKLTKESAELFEDLYHKTEKENAQLKDENIMVKKQMEQMISIMQFAVASDEGDQVDFCEQLKEENEKLRYLLQISDTQINSIPH